MRAFMQCHEAWISAPRSTRRTHAAAPENTIPQPCKFGKGSIAIGTGDMPRARGPRPCAWGWGDPLRRGLPSFMTVPLDRLSRTDARCQAGTALPLEVLGSLVPALHPEIYG